jgi:biopolymer transport protein TolQ
MDNPIISSFIQSGLFGKGILLVLLALSIYIWIVIQAKYILLKRMRQSTQDFFTAYARTGENIFQPVENEEYFEGLPVYAIFCCAKHELTRIMEEERNIDSLDAESIATQLARTVAETKMNLEEGLPALATATSIAPFLGLLGTVWGVMSAFLGMGELGNASIAAVAPGISEALVTTAVGLMVAIPAAIAYNYAKAKVQEQVVILNNFSLQVLGHIESKFVTRQMIR